ncbi:uncharacterized protein LOC113855599 [Abrus precatorius]|uniref:Uncharacterized protein LOC113855599 n=1 Tax=Abrus precatorius TaxID=3816 RepID=A0A8B8KGZ4_ABRPR|nr:uncharacterized protein LOC113855599 [Abrus precatorius]
MGSLRLSHATPQPQPQLTIGFPSTPQIFSISAVTFTHTSSASSASSSILRCKSSRRLQANQRLLAIFATNPKSPNEGSNVNETSNAAQGPPILTILAGFLIFFLFCWIIGSIIMWLISLIVNVPAAK